MATADLLGIALSSAAIFFAAMIVSVFLIELWDALAQRQFEEMAQRFEQLNLNTSRMTFWLRVWGAVLISGVIILGPILRAFPLAGVFAWLVYVAPRHILEYINTQRERLLEHQLVGGAMGLANSVKAGLSLSQGLATVSAETPEPLRTELARIVFQNERGRPLQEALQDTRRRLDLEAFTLFSAAIEVAMERGGRVNTALQRISVSLQERQRLRRKVEADTASGRQAVLILGLFPAAFLGMFYWLDPHGVELMFATFLGQFILVFVIGFVYLGVRWAVRIMRIRVA